MNPSVRRLLLPAVISLLLHYLLLHAVLHDVSLPAPPPVMPLELRVLMQQPSQTVVKPMHKAASKATLHPQAVHAEPRTAPPLAPAATDIPVEAALHDSDNRQALQDTRAALAELPPLSTENADAEKAQAQTSTTSTLTLQVPPSAQFSLELIRTENTGKPYYGVGKMRWQTDGRRYQLQSEANLDLFLTSLRLLALSSSGQIDSHGIAPDTLTESRRGRAETATHFQRDQALISFSSNAASVPLLPGAQDKATILMQLAAIGNGDPTQFVEGKEIAIQVAEEKEAGLFVFIIKNQESLHTKLGTHLTWHLVRPARAGSYNSMLEVWLAPDLNWYPIQLRNTESNGAVTTQTISNILSLPDTLP